MINRRRVTARLLAVGLMGAIAFLCGLIIPSPAMAAAADITVYRSPTCSCCGQWIDHMQAAGFHVQDIVTEDMATIKAEYGVPEKMASCHTAIAGGYLIEGHVPAADVQRLLSERPDILGIAAPGMPIGSPGMESGPRVDSYTVFSFDQTGETATFAEHP